MFRRRADDLLVATLEAGAVAFMACFIALEIRDWYGNGQFEDPFGFREIALHLLTIAVQATFYLRLAQRTGSVVMRILTDLDLSRPGREVARAGDAEPLQLREDSLAARGMARRDQRQSVGKGSGQAPMRFGGDAFLPIMRRGGDPNLSARGQARQRRQFPDIGRRRRLQVKAARR